MNPAALKTHLKDLDKDGILIVNRGRLPAQRAGQGRLHVRPADKTARCVGRRLIGRADHRAEPRGRRRPRRRPSAPAEPARGGSLQELLRARPRLLAVRTAAGTDARLDQGEIRPQPGGSGSQPPRPHGRLPLRRNHRSGAGAGSRGRARRCRPAAIARSPATRRWPWALSRRRARPGCRCCTPPIRSRRPPTCCTVWPT